MSDIVIGDPRPAGTEGPAGDQRQAGEEGPAGDPRPAGVEAAAAQTPAADTESFDPSDHTVDEVKAHLENADDAERERVLDAEKAGKARTSLIG